METKSPLLSKTLWMGLLTAVLAFIPVVQQWVSAHPDIYGMALSGIFMGLRLISKDKISIS